MNFKTMPTVAKLRPRLRRLGVAVAALLLASLPALAMAAPCPMAAADEVISHPSSHQHITHKAAHGEHASHAEHHGNHHAGHHPGHTVTEPAAANHLAMTAADCAGEDGTTPTPQPTTSGGDSAKSKAFQPALSGFHPLYAAVAPFTAPLSRLSAPNVPVSPLPVYLLTARFRI